MRKVIRGFSKFIVANAAVVLAILLLPVFLVTDDVSIFESIMNFLFDNRS
ncbi:hypothetical protein [Virgibacillus oceani]|uniref:Uncharacterized protein n=1 Tax=Virgibacillus oceani TaxID=1479511 RepID=A0A917M1U9_9BACI|nr:hypothetical protein [Virgibacillus oceani]GGG71444.1 hypothetical protein GCM10011398_14660 [Virgibacillus oceani]